MSNYVEYGGCAGPARIKRVMIEDLLELDWMEDREEVRETLLNMSTKDLIKRYQWHYKGYSIGNLIRDMLWLHKPVAGI